MVDFAAASAGYRNAIAWERAFVDHYWDEMVRCERSGELIALNLKFVEIAIMEVREALEDGRNLVDLGHGITSVDLERNCMMLTLEQGLVEVGFGISARQSVNVWRQKRENCVYFLLYNLNDYITSIDVAIDYFKRRLANVRLAILESQVREAETTADGRMILQLVKDINEQETKLSDWKAAALAFDHKIAKLDDLAGERRDRLNLYVAREEPIAGVEPDPIPTFNDADDDNSFDPMARIRMKRAWASELLEEMTNVESTLDGLGFSGTHLNYERFEAENRMRHLRIQYRLSLDGTEDQLAFHPNRIEDLRLELNNTIRLKELNEEQKMELEKLKGILKQGWPGWPDLVAAAKKSETDCIKCMSILKLFSKEFFVEMTQEKIEELKQSLSREFQLVHELCLFVLSTSKSTELIKVTLATLHAFLSWIPLGCIFESSGSSLLRTLLNFFHPPAHSKLTLQCLIEVAALNVVGLYDLQCNKMYITFMSRLQRILPTSSNIPQVYAAGDSGEQAFILNLALFFTSFFKFHIRALEATPEGISALLDGLEYLTCFSYVDDMEVFKVCLDYWNSLVLELSQAHHKATAAKNKVDGLRSDLVPLQLYSEPISKLRLLMISRMPKPEEVLIVGDKNGNIVRETLKDSDVLMQYKIMRKTLIHLAHLDHEDTVKQMLGKLSKQLNGDDWAWNNLNRLCWAIGSMSGSMSVEQENRFLVDVIRDLLKLYEYKEGKDNKAVIASNIMYVVGQYPRFLEGHLKYLKTVVKKLLEFRDETHPGVQDMACDTFLKFVQKCKRLFVITQVGESETLVSEILTTLPTTILYLEPHQMHTFFESVGHTIQVETDAQKREEYLQRLMGLPNQSWNELMGQAHLSVEQLEDVLNILQTNTSAATSLGTFFRSQISTIFWDMLTVYRRMNSEIISTDIVQVGPLPYTVILLRSVKREILKLIETFLDKAEDEQPIRTQFVSPVMDLILRDNLSDARESEVLSIFATIINKYKLEMMEENLSRILEAVLQCTLEMLTKKFGDCTEHPIKFFWLLRAIGTHCFPALFRLSSEQLKLVMDSIIWAFRHTERNIAETGLTLLLQMLKNFQAAEFCNHQFHQTYFLVIEQEIFAVLMDTFHKPGFKLHVMVLQNLFCLVESGRLTEPLWDVSDTYPNNETFVAQLVKDLFDSNADIHSFKTCIREFLVQLKEFSSQDNKDLYAEEAAEG